MTLTITPAQPADIPDLHRMIAQLCAFHGDTLRRGLAETQADLIDNPALTPFIAHKDTTACGFAVAERHWRPMDTGDGFDIAHLYVTEAHRNQGIGRALINTVRAYVTTLGAVRLIIGTAPHNPGAAAAYRAMGLDELTGPSGPRFAIPL